MMCADNDMDADDIENSIINPKRVLIMRVTFTFVLIFMFSLVYSQAFFDAANLFRPDNNVDYRADDFVSDAYFMRIDTDQLENILKARSSEIAFSIPVSDTRTFDMTLESFEVFSDDFVISTASGEPVENYKRGVFYHGKLQNHDGFATISIHDGELMGIVSVHGEGSFNLGRMQDSRDQYIIYNDRLVKVDMSIPCNGYLEPDEQLHRDERLQDIGLRAKTVKIYIEGDYALYLNKGSSISNTVSYMSGLFAQMATLFSNDGMAIEIKEIKVWDVADSYSTSDAIDALELFGENFTEVKGADLGHLFALGGVNLGGVAWRADGGVLCWWHPYYRTAYSNISAGYNNVPAYSWSVEVITHETGHNFGSRHTHACVWNGNNTQIDDCGNEYYHDNGWTPEGAACFDSINPILPTAGTIMSYCHLIGGIGIDFSLGFGPLVAGLMETNLNNSACITDAEVSPTCAIPVNVESVSTTSTTALLEWEVGQGPSKWQIQYGLSGFSIGSGTTISNIITNSHTLTALAPDTDYDWYIRSDCEGGDYSNWVEKYFSTQTIGFNLALKSLKGTPEKYVNRIEWTVAHELNTKKYVIQRSNDALHWTDIEIVDAEHNGFHENSYKTLDRNPLHSAYYRIGMISYDGSMHTSDVIFIARNDDLLRFYSVSPNPGREVFNVAFVSPDIDESLISMVNTLGVKVHSQYMIPVKGINNLAMDVSHLPYGIYTLIIEQGQWFTTHRLVIAR
jgi:hypothetical protein